MTEMNVVNPSGRVRRVALGALLAGLVLGVLGSVLVATLRHPTTGTVTVSGSATLTAKPDTVSFQIGLNATGTTPGAALAKNNTTVASVTSVLERDGVPAKDIQTSGLNVEPLTNATTGAVTGYGASDDLSVTTALTGTIGTTIDQAVLAGGAQASLSGITFSLVHDAAVLARARERAVSNARAMAEGLGRAGDFRVGAIKSLVDTENQQTPGPVGFTSAVAAGVKSSVPIASGTETVSVQVNVVFDTSVG